MQRGRAWTMDLRAFGSGRSRSGGGESPRRRSGAPRRRWGAIAIILAAISVASLGLLRAEAQPTNFVAIDGNIRHQPGSGATFDWGNSGTTFDNTTCANGGIHAVGTNGLFDCGKAGTSTGPTDTNPVPVPPT